MSGRAVSSRLAFPFAQRTACYYMRTHGQHSLQQFHSVSYPFNPLALGSALIKSVVFTSYPVLSARQEDKPTSSLDYSSHTAMCCSLLQYAVIMAGMLRNSRNLPSLRFTPLCDFRVRSVSEGLCLKKLLTVLVLFDCHKRRFAACGGCHRCKRKHVFCYRVRRFS